MSIESASGKTSALRALLIVTALVEAGTGALLLAVPSFVAELLLGEGLSSAPALVVARITGAALIAIAVACWLGSNGQRREQTALVVGMLLYNLAVPLVLIQAWIASSLEGWGLWPASVLHMLLGLWCVACLRTLRQDRWNRNET